MKRIWGSGAFERTLIAAAAVLFVSAGAGAALASGGGDRMAEIVRAHALSTLDGRTGRIEPSAAPVSVLHFWASWCGPCKKELPLLDDLAAELAPRGARFAAISIDSDPANARRFVERHEISMPVFLDGPDGLAESLALPSVPCTFVLDRSGEVTFASVGASPEELARLRAHLLDAVRGTDSTPANPLGSGPSTAGGEREDEGASRQ